MFWPTPEKGLLVSKLTNDNEKKPQRVVSDINVKFFADEDNRSEFKEVDVKSDDITSRLVNTLVVLRMMVRDTCEDEILDIFDAIAKENGIELVEVPDTASRH